MYEILNKSCHNWKFQTFGGGRELYNLLDNTISYLKLSDFNGVWGKSLLVETTQDFVMKRWEYV